MFIPLRKQVAMSVLTIAAAVVVPILLVWSSQLPNEWRPMFVLTALSITFAKILLWIRII